MRKILIGMMAVAAIATASATANAGERQVTGAAIGAGAGLVVAGPVGAVVGGVVGYTVGGPRISHRHCWHDSAGYRHCR